MHRVLTLLLISIIIIAGIYAFQFTPFAPRASIAGSTSTSPLPMTQGYLWRYQSPTGTSDCQWVGARMLIVFAGTAADVTCFHTANPSILTMAYDVLEAGISDPVYTAANSTASTCQWYASATVECNWIHIKTGVRAFYTFNSINYYHLNLNSTVVRNAILANRINSAAATGWKTMGVDGMFIDNFGAMNYGGNQLSYWNGACCIEYPNTAGNLASQISAYQQYLRDTGLYVAWAKSQMGKTFYMIGNIGPYYWAFADPTYPIAAVNLMQNNGWDGLFLETFPWAATYSDISANFLNMQINFNKANPNGFITFFPNAYFPSYYWLYSYYQTVRNTTTKNLLISPLTNYPVPANIGGCGVTPCDGWNATLWEKLNLGLPTAPPTVINNPGGSATANIYTRPFQNGYIISSNDRVTTDTATYTATLPRWYIDFKTGKNVTSITVPVAGGAWVGCTSLIICQGTFTPPPPALATSFTYTPTVNITTSTNIAFTSSSSGGTSPYTTTWKFGDGQTSTGASTTHQYTTIGSYAVNESVVDAAGKTASSLQTIKVGSAQFCTLCGTSVLTASFTYTPTPLYVNVPGTFSATIIGGTAPYAVSWNFGDGTGIATSQIATHSFASSGSFTVTFTVTDSKGLSTTSTQTLSITAAPAGYMPPPPPVIPVFQSSLFILSSMLLALAVYRYRRRAQ